MCNCYHHCLVSSEQYEIMRLNNRKLQNPGWLYHWACIDITNIASDPLYRRERCIHDDAYSPPGLGAFSDPLRTILGQQPAVIQQHWKVGAHVSNADTQLIHRMIIRIHILLKHTACCFEGVQITFVNHPYGFKLTFITHSCIIWRHNTYSNRVSS